MRKFIKKLLREEMQADIDHLNKSAQAVHKSLNDKFEAFRENYTNIQNENTKVLHHMKETFLKMHEDPHSEKMLSVLERIAKSLESMEARKNV